MQKILSELCFFNVYWFFFSPDKEILAVSCEAHFTHFSTYTDRWLFSVIMNGGYQALGLLRHSSAFPCPTVHIHHTLHPKSLHLQEPVWQRSSNKGSLRGKESISLYQWSGTHYSHPEDQETCLHRCQQPPAWKRRIPTCHRALRSPRTCFWLESGHCGQGFLPTGQATLK